VTFKDLQKIVGQQLDEDNPELQKLLSRINPSGYGMKKNISKQTLKMKVTAALIIS
jgi:hypothetical protein